MIRRGLLAAAAVVVLGGGAGSAAAHTFEIGVTIQRPAEMSTTVPGLREANPQGGSQTQWVPATFQLVHVWQPGQFGPQFCGSGYTNSQGRLDGVVFSCGTQPPLQIQIEVLGESARGFRVGSNSPWPQEQLHVAYAWHWYSAWMVAFWGSSSVADNGAAFGIFQLGGGGTLNTSLDYRAAAIFELVDFLYQQWNLGFLPTRPSPSPTPLFTHWIVNDFLSTFGLTAPWTYWTTVHMPAGTSGKYLMWSTPHELGHVLYNLNHSGWDHYSVEVTNYMTNHSSCTGVTAHFGAYEGFANAFWALTWSGYSSAYNSLGGCPDTGITLEGNVQEFYAHAFAGERLERSAATLHDWTTHRIGANLYAFPPSRGVLGMVAGAGMNAEDVATMWTSSLRGICAGSSAGAPAYCGSRRFKCMVRDKALLSPGELPDFDNPNCAPGASSIVAVTRPSLEGDALTVQFAPSDLADSYELVIARSTGTTSTAINVSSQDVLSTLTASATVPRCESATLSIKTTFGGVTTQGPVNTGTWGCNRTSSTKIVVEPIPLTPWWY